MSIAIRQIHPVFVGEVSGIDGTRPLSPGEVAAIDAGMDRYAVLVLRDQRFTDEQQMAFTTQFGPLEETRGGNITKPHERRLQVGMGDVSNLDQQGAPMARESRQRLFNLGNMLWHSDSSYRPIPAKYSLLSARVVNPVGGNTEFADMRAAYDALDGGLQAEIEDLICEHSLLYSRGSLGLTEYSEEERAMFRPVRQRLVRTHPVTGRKSLYLSAHAGAIIGMPTPEAAHPAARADRARHPAPLRVRPRLAPVGLRHVGQPPGDAPRAALRRVAAPRHAAHHHRG
jgi:alpha-ketoglutarate-dependent 2,4-dichlorophenoxyacetate dioxygenase